MKVTQEKADQIRRTILADNREAKLQFTRLAKDDHSTILELCHWLLQDSAVPVQQVILLLLGQQGDSHDRVAEASALKALANPALQDRAFFALGRVATPDALHPLFRYAKQDFPEALEALNHLVTTEEDIVELL